MPTEDTVSMVIEVPESLFEEMTAWMAQFPDWDPVRVSICAYSLFLLQQCEKPSRRISRYYLNSIFP